MANQKQLKLSQTEQSYIKENFRDKLPKEIADTLGLPIRLIREQIEVLEKLPAEETIQDAPIKEDNSPLKERPSVMKGMKGDYTGGMVMTQAASERGDDFAKKKTHVPDKFKDAVGKIYK